MYQHFYGLRARPFDLTPDPRFLVATKAHAEALGNLEYAIAGRKGITLLVGEAGTGKTTIIRAAIEKQSAQTHCVHLQNPALTRDEFVEILAARFGLSERAGASKACLLLELEELLRRRRDAHETTVLLVDEAQSLSLELLEELRLLTNIETGEGKLLTLVLAGQPELAARLDEPELRQLKQRVSLRCELRCLTQEEGVAYVAGRLERAGGVPAQIFTREAVVLIYERSQGIPRTINVIADNALVTGFAARVRPVTSEIVGEVCRDFDIAPTDLAPPVPAPGPAERQARTLSEDDHRALDAAVGPARPRRPEPVPGAAGPPQPAVKKS